MRILALLALLLMAGCRDLHVHIHLPPRQSPPAAVEVPAEPAATNTDHQTVDEILRESEAALFGMEDQR